ncbi:hypothetical protein [Nocardioides flavus (ex Wang et al. 2016)]|uniref:hypothetical protein n=1 Tax=Nocardioides flavus (ex Wang et al. 2016) TaxID=2058780 RepID=UPI00174C01DA|nr:hypothetical protein [Nocardioides flavus (ex Wang et al. 2016)]
MSTARPAAVLALLGGALWIVHALLGGGDAFAGTLRLIGLACLLVASAVFGATLVKSDAVAMRVVVALASGLLTLSLIEAFRPADSRWYDAFWGVLAALIGGVALLRGRGDTPRRPSTGAHAR